jgi:hypothetical protein
LINRDFPGIMSSGTLRNELYERSKAIKKKKKIRNHREMERCESINKTKL